MSGEIHRKHNRIEEIRPPVKCDSETKMKHDEDDEINRQVFTCNICTITVTSARMLQRHLDGRKHKLRAERQGKCFKCDLCDLVANSEIQLSIHLSSSKHKLKVQRRECAEFTKLSTSSKGLWIIAFCAVCIFMNLLLLFKMTSTVI